MPTDHTELLIRMDEKLDGVVKDMAEVKDQVKATNGRVRGLELFKARVLATGAMIVIASPVWLPHLLG